MALEAAADRFGEADRAYALGFEGPQKEGRAICLDWGPLVEGLLQDQAAGSGIEPMAARFHATLVAAVVTVARQVGETAIVLCGGCFQNRRLLAGCVDALARAGFRVYWPQRVPPNDGGLALGQWTVARWRGEAGKALFRKTT
jgi:hydrogenase maturation protein HypF